MPRPSYAVVTSVVTFLALLGFAAQTLRPRIPERPGNDLAGNPSEFLAQGGHQPVAWRPVGEAAFLDARRQGLPIALLVGAPWSQYGRAADQTLFVDPAVATYLNRNFVCIRADLLETPEWMNAFLPVTRARLRLLPGWQLWFLDPEGRVYDLYGRTPAMRSPDVAAFLEALIAARRRFENLGDPAAPAPPGAVQEEDLGRLRIPGPGPAPDFEAFNAVLANRSDRVFGGVPDGPVQSLRGSVWRYLARNGDAESVRRSLEPMLLSPLHDPVNGGFFRIANRRDWTEVEVDKLAVSNAEVMHALAMASARFNDPLYAWAADRAFESLAFEMTQEGMVATAVVGDELRNGRSAARSFSPRMLREQFDPEEREWLREHLDLRAESNPAMLPRLTSRAVLDDPRFESLRAELGKRVGPPRRVGVLLLDAGGYAVARMIETARLRGDAAKLDLALDLFDRLERWRVGDDVLHGLATHNRSHSTLLDYLSFSDAALQAFLATGREEYLRRGAAVLRRAQFLFAGDAPGAFVLERPRATAVWAVGTASPEVVDNVVESGSARMMRLLWAYRSLLRTDPASGVAAPPEAVDFAQGLESIGALFSQTVVEIGPAAAGLADAYSLAGRDEVLLVAGPDAVAEANRLARRAPEILVAPLKPPVRPDLATLAPTILRVRNGKVVDRIPIGSLP